MKRSTKPVFIILFLLLLLVFGYSAYRVTSTLHQYSESERYYERTRKTAVSTKDPLPADGKDPSGEAPAEAVERSPVSVDFEALRQICPDVKAWLYLPDTVIDYPVLQGKDNEYYLHRLLDGSSNKSGSIFYDYRNSADLTDRNTIIYGHNMGDHSMFAVLPSYREQSFYDSHPVLYLNTPDGDYRLDVFAGFVTWYDSSAFNREFGSRTEFMDWLGQMRGYSEFSSDVQVEPDDRIVTLSTCSYDYDDARFVLMAKLVPLDK